MIQALPRKGKSMLKTGRLTDYVLLFVGSLCLFLIGIRPHEIIGFETRFYLFAMEMFHNGPTWFPTTYGKYYPDYPVLSTYFIYLLAKLIGTLNKFIAVLPSAIAASIAVCTTYLIGALHSRRYGIIAASFLLMTNMFVMEARTISTDQYIVMVTTLAFYCVYSADVLQRYSRLMWLPFILLFGMACRGPIGFIIPASVVSTFYILEKDLKKFFLFSSVALVFLSIGGAILFYIAKHVGGDQFVNEVWRLQVANRLENAWLPWYFYFTESMGAYAITYPIAILGLLGWGSFLVEKNQTRETKFIWKLIGWVLVILIGLSIPAGKKIRYVLAIAPALALLSAALFTFHYKNKFLFVLRTLVRLFCVCLPTLALTTVVIAYVVLTRKALNVEIYYRIAIALFFVLQCYMFCARRNDLKIFLAAAVTFIMIYITVVEPINFYLDRTRIFVASVEVLRNTQQANLYFYHEDPDGLPIKYLANANQLLQPHFIYSAPDLKKLHDKNIIITSKEYFATLPASIIQHARILFLGNLGREPMIVFTMH